MHEPVELRSYSKSYTEDVSKGKARKTGEKSGQNVTTANQLHYYLLALDFHILPVLL